jgi:hypothetical protein
VTRRTRADGAGSTAHDEMATHGGSVSLPVRTLVAVLVLAAGCAQPVAGLWPPRAGEPTHRVIVSTDNWHSVIGLPRDDGRLDEWSYASKAYYLEREDGFFGTLSAVFIPGDAVVLTRVSDRPWAETTTQPPGRSWTFDLSEEGYARLVAYVAAERASETPCSHAGGALWFDATSSYGGLHHCQHWTASALREAGLPVWSVYALFKWSLEAQLDRAEAMAESR